MPRKFVLVLVVLCALAGSVSAQEIGPLAVSHDDQAKAAPTILPIGNDVQAAPTILPIGADLEAAPTILPIGADLGAAPTILPIGLELRHTDGTT